MGAALGGVDVQILPATSVREAVRALGSLPRPDIVNTHMSDADLAGIVFRGRKRRPQVVSTRHFGARRGSSWPVRVVFGAASARIDAQIAISDFVASQIEGESVVVRTGVADSDIEATHARGRTVLMAQRLEAEKHTDTGLRAWAIAEARKDEWQLVIAGEGAQRPALERLAAHLDIADSVRFLGYRTDIDVLMNEAGMLLAPTPHEGLGLSVLEGMARALPTVASASGGHLETVGGVAEPALFAPGDARGAAAQIDRLAGSSSARLEYGDRLRARQRSEFGIRRQVERITEVYERVLSR
jgi:glycosyltransferase involved in cell wall biosynthesis